MKTTLRLLLLLLTITTVNAFADSRVFTLVTPHPEEVLQALRNTYGDKIKADIVQGRLLVVGNTQQLDEVAALLVKLDPTPRALRLRLREHPPTDTSSNTITYSTDMSGYTIDTVEGAFVAIDYQKIAQQPKSIASQPSQQTSSASPQSSMNGWWVMIENTPTQIDSLTLNVHIEGGRRAIVLVSYTKEKNQERRVFGNTLVGDLGTWIPLLPRPEDSDDNTISSGPKRGEQLYLRVDKNFDALPLRN